MKKYTVMLIPHDRSSTRQFTLSKAHFWGAIGLIAFLVFFSAFFYQRSHVLAKRTKLVKEAKRALELRQVTPAAPETEPPATVDENSSSEAEAEMRAEYERTIATITTELNNLYEMETKARNITGLAPREDKADKAVSKPSGGQGGPPGIVTSLAYSTVEPGMRPPQVIYGLARPSADLILQEIQLRTRSLEDLVADMEAEIDRIERMPSVWPLAAREGRITSRYGVRRDPFSRRYKHHNGTDIGAPTGTPVRATGKGTVVAAPYDRFLGRFIRIDHGNGYRTVYAHLSKQYVKKGDFVQREDVIGAVGSTGRSTGPHLHYEVHKNSKSVNPAKYLTD